MAVLNAVTAGLATVAELDEAFANFLESPGWRELQTRTARRMCDGSYTFNGDPFAAPPAHLQFAQGLIQKLVGHLQSSNPTSQVLPLQAFLCLYEDGEDACPNHVHDCRQLTLSLGADREVTIEGQRVMMRHGDILVLDGERHGVPAQKTKSSQSRVSINIFLPPVVIKLRGLWVLIIKQGIAIEIQPLRKGKGRAPGLGVGSNKSRRWFREVQLYLVMLCARFAMPVSGRANDLQWVLPEFDDDDWGPFHADALQGVFEW